MIYMVTQPNNKKYSVLLYGDKQLTDVKHQVHLFIKIINLNFTSQEELFIFCSNGTAQQNSFCATNKSLRWK